MRAVQSRDDLGGRGRAATALLEFAPGRFHSLNQLRAPVLSQSMLEHLHQRLLFFDGQSIGGIQNLCKFRHAQSLAAGRT